MKFTVKDTGEIQKVVIKDKLDSKPENPSEDAPNVNVLDVPNIGNNSQLRI